MDAVDSVAGMPLEFRSASAVWFERSAWSALLCRPKGGDVPSGLRRGPERGGHLAHRAEGAPSTSPRTAMILSFRGVERANSAGDGVSPS